MIRKYVKLKSSESFLARLVQNSFAYIFIYSFFFLYPSKSITNQSLIKVSSLVLLINAILRFSLNFLYTKKKLKVKLRKMIFFISTFTIINAFGWSIILTGILFSKPLDVHFVLFAGIVTFTLVANSIFILAAYPWINYLFSTLSFIPLIAFTFSYGNETKDQNFYYFAFLFLVYLTYVYKQAKRANKEESDRYSLEYELKKSIIMQNRSSKIIQEQNIINFHNSRLSSLGEMTSSIAHEINNPLTIVIGNIQSIIKRHPEINEELKENLSKTLSAAERINKIIKSMKLFSNRNDDQQMKYYSIQSIIESGYNLYSERAKHLGIDINVHIHHDCEVKCNQVQISQIFINLINNAIDAVDGLEEKEKYVSIIVFKRENELVINIENGGPKISQVMTDKIFQPFFTSKPIGKGTGLGLSISKKLAQLHNGNLTLLSDTQKTTFQLTLPI
jgi:signal transduction histidine kinase